MKQIFLAMMALSLVACSRPREDIIRVRSDDAEMTAAIAEAQRTLPEFWSAREKDGGDFAGLLKVYFSDPGNDQDGEHMWVCVTGREPRGVAGVLLDEPGWVKSVKQGQKVRFPNDRITDWLVVQGGKAHGAYTVRLLRKRMSPEERRRHDEGYPFAFD